MSSPEQEPDWSSLPSDLLRDVLTRLPWSSHPSFAATCTHWRTVVTPFYPAWLTPLLLNAVDVGSTNVRYYSPYYHKNFEVDQTLGTPDATIFCSNGQYLTLCQLDMYGKLNVVHANIVTGVVFNLEPLERINFDFVLYDGDRRIFGVKAVGDLTVVRTTQQLNDKWNDYWWWGFSDDLSDDDEETKFRAAPMTNAVLHRGLLYLLACDGRLAVHDDRESEKGFQVLDKPREFGLECDEYYLFESEEGVLAAVLVEYPGSPLHVVKLNEDKMEWEKVESLEGRALFTGTRRTMLVKTDVEWMQNKVFFPRVYDWPETVDVDLVERGGELAFVPVSTGSTISSKDGGACGNHVWTCGLKPEDSAQFWETTKFDYSIWVDFNNRFLN